MNNKQLESDLKRCLELISADWKMQNNRFDRATNFIYKASTLDECLMLIQQHGVDRDYALHRWYNYMTSVAAEYLFCEFGAVHEKDVYNHDVDIYIGKAPYDVKLTIYPAKLSNKPYDLRTRHGKNQMIRWYYENQSQQGRKQLLNRLYIVCDAETADECLRLKSDFAKLRAKISAFMAYISKHGLNKIDITDNGNDYELYSDIIYITAN